MGYIFLGVYSKLRNKVLNMSINTKITLFYFVFIAFTVCISVFLYTKIHLNVMKDKLSEVSMQTLFSINSNLNSTIGSINNYSKMIISNKAVREALLDEHFIDFHKAKEANDYLMRLIEEIPTMSSIYIFDISGNRRAAADKRSVMWMKIRNVRKAHWFKSVNELRGAYILELNAGDIFYNTPDNNFVSLIRMIRDIDSQEPIGYMVINISEKVFVDSFERIIDKSDMEIILLDKNNNAVMSNNNKEKYHLDEFILAAENEGYYSKVTNIENKQYIQSIVTMERHGWKIISLIPFELMSDESKSLSIITFIIILLNGIILFIGSILISKMITKPVKKLIKAMKKIENREFKMVNIKSGKDEIGKLKEGYNMMIKEIQNLLQKTIEEQKIKRKAELNVLQAQVKPHFLYNTLDAMGYLALSGKNDELYEGLEALGSYYRNSLSKGKEVITIKKEIEIVKSYLTIQKIRYGDDFSVIYDIDEKAYPYHTLKLVLQPLVENALYHGIKPKGETGIIKVSVVFQNDSIIMSVEDDGIGMDEDKLNAITKDNIDKNSLSFGLKGTIKRLQFFYGISDVYSIESKKRVGTKVSIIIPLERGDGDD
ncbi:UNVERIFIED_CONTAM: two-component system sensor histidine kinase YesM [Acetivibrio alkalicellulosi]